MDGDLYDALREGNEQSTGDNVVADIRRQLSKAQLDTERLEWVMDILSLTDENPDEKALKLVGALMLGKKGRDAIDCARGTESANV